MASLRIYFFLFCAILLMKGKVGSAVRVTLLKSAVTKGAVCLDGSAPAYQFDEGFGEGVGNWLIGTLRVSVPSPMWTVSSRIGFLVIIFIAKCISNCSRQKTVAKSLICIQKGGAWCESPEECMKRTHNRYGLGSSFRIKKGKFKGILSKKQEYNPNFYNWNRILVKYCDGSSFTGNAETFYQGTKLYLRGARIFDAIVEDLQTRGMHNASNLGSSVAGSSAGGLASILNCDKFRAFLPLTTKVKCISDGGYFIHAKDVYGKYQFQKVMFDRVGSVKNLPQECTSKIEPSLCFYPQFVAPFIRTPLFILNSSYDSFQIENILALTNADVDHSWVGGQYNIEKCSSSQMKILEGFRSKLVQGVLKGLHNDSSGGFFINSCYTHCQSLDQRTWLGYRGSALNNKTISDVVGEWYYDKGIVQLIDHQNQLPHWCGLDETEPNP